MRSTEKTVDPAGSPAHLRGVHSRRPTIEDVTPVLTFRLPRKVADELGRFVTSWQGVFMAVREYEEQHPESAAWFMTAAKYGNPDASGARGVPLSESSFVLGAILHAMKEYAEHIQREAEANPLNLTAEQIESDPLFRLAAPLRMWALTHPHTELWALQKKAAEATLELAEKRRRRANGQRPAQMYGAKKTARANARRAIPQPASGEA